MELELKLIADIGLVGFPNAGKSSLLRAISAATPAVAAYPFTTVHPMVGVVEYRDGERVLVADIPGLLEGASQGRGHGHEFLRHVERTKALAYMVDVAGVDSDGSESAFRNRGPLRDLEVLAEELAAYGDGNLRERKAVVVGNKIDLLHHDKALEMEFLLQQRAEELGLESQVLMISAGVSGHGLAAFAKAIRDATLLDNDSDAYNS